MPYPASAMLPQAFAAKLLAQDCYAHLSVEGNRTHDRLQQSQTGKLIDWPTCYETRQCVVDGGHKAASFFETSAVCAGKPFIVRSCHSFHFTQGKF